MSNPIFDDLNPKQREAVEILAGPLLILAGAGSGKTKCLTHRIANLIANGIPADQILAVTFTNKAANEMKTRVEKLLESSSRLGSAPWVATFHATCVRILRQDVERLECGISRNFVIFDTDDSQSLMKQLMREKQMDPKEIKFKAILSHISAAKNQLVTPEEYASSAEPNRFTRAVGELFLLYQKRLAEHNALDFDDLLQKTVELFEQCPAVLNKYKSRWQHLLIDEYQDTNFAQYRFVRLLADDHKNLCVIGDDHQSIYSFRGADYTNILNFEKDFPATRVIKLEQNYRSTGHILTCANAVISHNQTGHPKNLWTENEAGEKVSVREVQNEREEGNMIAEEITELIRSGAAHYSDCAVLYRMNAQSRALEEALLRHQIPYQIVGGVRFFDRREIKDVVAYLRLIFNPRDDTAFLRIINVPARKIGPASLEILRKHAQERAMSLFEILQNADEITDLPETKKAMFKKFRNEILELQKISKTEGISLLLEHLIEKIDFFKWLDDGTPEGEARIQNVRELFSVAARYDGAETPLASFLEGVALISDLDSHDENAETVTLMTIHSSKGLEFPIVFLPGWEDGIFPSASSQFSADQIEEERRLAYVAITRTEKKCTILHARSRMLFGQTDFSSPSKFLAELEEASVDHGTEEPRFFAPRKANFETLTRSPRTRTEAIFGIVKNETGFQIGSRLRHAEFGEGTVVQISGDVLSVAFGGKGIKRIVASVAPIEAIAE